MSIQLKKTFNIGDTIKFKGGIVEILDYAGTVLTRYGSDIVNMQLYQVSFKGDVYFASDNGLLSKNPKIFDKCIAGVGYRGSVNYIPYEKEYKIWKDMLYRCFSTTNKMYTQFGAIGVTVDPKWLCFELFLYDLVSMQHYEKIHKGNGMYELDLKMKQKNIPEGERVYANGRVAIRLFPQTDVSEAYNKIKTLGTNLRADGGDIKQTEEQQPKKVEFKPMADGRYPKAAYDYVISNQPKLSVPSINSPGYNCVRILNGVHYNNRPPIRSASSIIRENNGDMKVMCVIVDDK